MTWMRLPKEFRTEISRFVILPIAYEKNPTYGGGASKGPEEIIKASDHLEYYDERFDSEAFIEGIRQLPTLQLSDLDPQDMVKTLAGVVADQNNKFVIGLGGDHAVTIGMLKGMEKIHGENFSVIVLDAHTDFRDSWNNSPYNHACVSKQASHKHDVVLIGVRSSDVDEAAQVKTAKNVHVIKAYDDIEQKLVNILPKLKEKVYVSIDVDVFDLSMIRNTGTPEPGGMSWNQVVRVLNAVFCEKEVIGCDIVEFAPKLHFKAEAYALAKLAYLMMCLKSKQK